MTSRPSGRGVRDGGGELPLLDAEVHRKALLGVGGRVAADGLVADHVIHVDLVAVLAVGPLESEYQVALDQASLEGLPRGGVSVAVLALEGDGERPAIRSRELRVEGVAERTGRDHVAVGRELDAVLGDVA